MESIVWLQASSRYCHAYTSRATAAALTWSGIVLPAGVLVCAHVCNLPHPQHRVVQRHRSTRWGPCHKPWCSRNTRPDVQPLCAWLAEPAFKHAYDPTLAPPVSEASGNSSGSEQPASVDMYYSEIVQPKKAPKKNVMTLLMYALCHCRACRTAMLTSAHPREELYRLLLVLVLLAAVGRLCCGFCPCSVPTLARAVGVGLVQVAGFGVVPYVGTPMAIVLSWYVHGRLICVVDCSLASCGVGTSFIYAFYSFEYKWALEGVPLTERMEQLETNWVFLLGFGLPFTLATYSFSFFVSGGLYALLFPVVRPVSCRVVPAGGAAHVRRLGTMVCAQPVRTSCWQPSRPLHHTADGLDQFRCSGS